MQKKTFTTLLMLALLTACNNDVAERRKPGYGEASAPISQEIKITVNSVDKPDSLEFQKLMNAGVIAAGKDFPTVKLKIEQAPNQDAQIQQIAQSAADAKAIVLNISNNQAVIPLMKDLCTKKIPVVFFGASPDKRALAACDLDYDLRGDDMTAGVVQGLLVAQAFNENPAMDKNHDGTIQYAFMKATQGTEFTRDRSDWAVATMSSYPELARPVSELMVSYANFDPALGLKNLEAWIANPRFADVEVILTNNDDTAIAIANELKKRGINIPVYGSDGGEAGLRAVKSGLLAGTARGDYQQWAHDAVRVAANLGLGRPPLEGLPTSYRMEERTIYPPFVGISAKNVDEFLK